MAPAAAAALSGTAMTGSATESTNQQLPPVARIKAVLFDVDGTLADSDPLHFLAFQEILQEVNFQGGQPITEQFFRERISGRHNPDIGRDLFPDWSEERREALLVDKEARFRKLAAQKTVEVPGLSRFCSWIEKNNIRRAAVTNAPRENAEQMIASLGLTSFFETLVIGAECQQAKPHPDPYLVAMERLEVNVDEAFAVEDSPSGLKAAVSAGLATIGVLTGQEASVLETGGAAFVISDFNDPHLWEKLASEP